MTLGQGDGTEVELIVNGTELYATYETLDGYPAIYDNRLEVFCLRSFGGWAICVDRGFYHFPG